jgi:hypothetical protein
MLVDLPPAISINRNQQYAQWGGDGQVASGIVCCIYLVVERRCNIINANPNPPTFSVDDGADDFGATTFDEVGFINTEEVWAMGVPSRVKAH